ncbi:HTH_Tnp_Tc3_2 domain-containing protein [Trichonephila clavipes]|nr:HTH_Tnp_Tc3_2 domain-containing protein [Trichonephila clavipes]
MTANLYVDLVVQPIVLPFLNVIQRGDFQQDNALLFTPLLFRNVLYRMLKSYLGLRDHQICLQLWRYGVSLDRNYILIHSQP